MMAWRGGDPTAFDTLYHRHRQRLLRFLIHETGSTAAGEEVFQEVWMTLIRQRESYQPLARFSTFLLGIAHSRLVDWFRRHSRHRWNSDLDTAAEVADHCPLPEQLAANRQLQQQLRNCLRQLPPEQREAFLLKEEHELGLHEIAELTRSAAETVKSRIRYAISKLRTCLSGATQHD
ncbi:sigma-70 family RNA polymerase sigma factor [Chitinilyticum piscinae]|uniref:Sigma-70 family RNA polymerase sigma factor n=1 Tax=Chitinilyticum piscinae TaxID=2866724 RepID=A0A8J7FJC8_9NEIS|nr:sigma-70 family RNA polymerase sigma factor [Chitinilyticum piscinae]MBE9610450.1 sigma-70 family RNA polymerase sigma factor [Chitinilyticum piscinae]